ncbi:Nif11-like leader peptide family natural product precursor [Nannocystis pusilla]|uniref:Nif11-like leader peptide family natural product precursor n=1 Tax=Nannocystis pusilla TaxID=889268 RepID=UPI003B7F4212
MKNDASEFLAAVAASTKLQAEVNAAKTPLELLKVAETAGYKLENHALSSAVRSVAAKALAPLSLPHWAVDSMFLGESVCW